MWSRLFLVVVIGTLAPTFVYAQVQPAQKIMRAAEFLALEDVQQKNNAPEFLKPLINLELSFIKRVCDPSDDQMAAMVKEAESIIGVMSDIVRVPGQVGMRGGVAIVFRGPNQEQLVGNPYHRVRKEMAIFVKPRLTPQQYDLYLEESTQRDEFEREVAIDIAVEMIDTKLVLTSEQRAEITQKLLQGWQQVDFQWMQSYLNNPQYLPTMPSGLIESILTPTQINLWNSVNRTRVILHASVVNANSFGLDEEWIK